MSAERHGKVFKEDFILLSFTYISMVFILMFHPSCHFWCSISSLFLFINLLFYLYTVSLSWFSNHFDVTVFCQLVFRRLYSFFSCLSGIYLSFFVFVLVCVPPSPLPPRETNEEYPIEIYGWDMQISRSPSADWNIQSERVHFYRPWDTIKLITCRWFDGLDFTCTWLINEISHTKTEVFRLYNFFLLDQWDSKCRKLNQIIFTCR